MDKADQELNKIYRALAKDGNNKLREAEKLWIQLKEQDCKSWLSDVYGSNEYLLTLYACPINKIKKRINELQTGPSYGVCARKTNNKELLFCLEQETQWYNKQIKMIDGSLL